MNLIKFIVQKKILIGLSVVLILLIGVNALSKLDKELMPGLTFDGAYVAVDTGDMSAIEVERTITNPLEQSLLAMDGVEGVQSTSNIGRSSLQITLEGGKGDELIKEVESVVHETTSTMTGIKNLETGQMGMSQSYEFYLDVSGGDMKEMTTFAKDVLEPRLEALSEVRDVSLLGTLENEVVIKFNQKELMEKGIAIEQVIGAIQQSNSEATLGELQTSAKENSTLRWNTKLSSVNDVEMIQVPTEQGYVDLKDLAEITMKPLESSSYVWKNGTKDLIFVQVGRTSDVTQIEMAEAVRAEIKDIRSENIINGFELNEMVAQADYVEDAIDGVTTNIIIGSIIAIAILLLFLRNIRATVIIGVSIPTSILLTFIAMWVLDYSFNLLTLIGLGLGIGMMVDSSIVILESIYRKKEQGLEKFEAVVQGTKEVATAVIASMLTTIVVFLPIGLLGGEMGQFMIMLSVVVAITLISSVLISFSLIPSLSEKFLRVKDKKKKQNQSRLVNFYSKIVSWTVRKKRNSFAIIGLFFLILVSSLFFVTKIPMTIMPDFYNRYQELMVDIETGITIADKEELVSKINEQLSSIEDVESNYVMDNGGMLYTIINMTKGDDITREQTDVNEDIFSSLRELQNDYPVESVLGAMSAGGGYPVQVTIEGGNFAELQNVSSDFIKELSEIDGIVGAVSSIDRTSTEQVIELKQEELDNAGLFPAQVQQYIQQAFLNMPVGEMAMDDETVPIRATWDSATNTESDLLGLTIPTPSGEQKLSQFISLKTIDTPNEINHNDGERYVAVSADIEDKDLGTINREVQNLISDFESPDGYTVSAAGDLEQQQQLMMDMLLVLGIAIFLVYLVMAVQFNHLGHPLVVMSVIPMTIVGVIIGLFLTQQELSAMSAMGIIMLIGIVLNNAILLIDRTNQLRKEGYLIQDALVTAGKDRIRPIFMTTLTTAGGMLPLALATGTSSSYQAPMATAIISGLLFATLITLLLIPAVYRLYSKKEKAIETVKKIKTEELKLKREIV